jgi:hypothetical protein
MPACKPSQVEVPVLLQFKTNSSEFLTLNRYLMLQCNANERFWQKVPSEVTIKEKFRYIKQ